MLSITFLVLPVGFIPKGVVKEDSESVMFQFPQFQTNYLGDRPSKILASGGSDGIVRLWSLDCSGKRSQHDLKAVLYGHDKPAVLMSVAGYDLIVFAYMLQLSILLSCCAAKPSCLGIRHLALLI